MKSQEKVFTKILVEIKGGAIVNITDLPKEHYEHFLKLTEALSVAYNVIINRAGRKADESE